jgi:hypothetical protein
LKISRYARDTALAWSALAAGAFAWFGSQQLGSNWVFAGCSPGDGLFDVLISLIALALIAGGAFLSWRIWRGVEDDQAAHPFIALVGTLTGAILAIAIILQAAAGLIIPSCVG